MAAILINAAMATACPHLTKPHSVVPKAGATLWFKKAQCNLFSVVFTPPTSATTAVFGSYLSSFYSD
jgi:hypothetical protein